MERIERILKSGPAWAEYVVVLAKGSTVRVYGYGPADAASRALRKHGSMVLDITPQHS